MSGERYRTIEQLAALAQATRMAVFRKLMNVGDGGLAAGALAQQLDVAPNTLSAHLSVLQKAGLIKQKREGRRLIYSVVTPEVASLIDTLIHDCCHGHPAVYEQALRKVQAADHG